MGGEQLPREQQARGAKQRHHKSKEHKRQFFMNELKVAYHKKFCYFGCQLVWALAIALHNILLYSFVRPPPPEKKSAGRTKAI